MEEATNSAPGAGESTTPMVSIIVSTYNRIHFLERALRSILAQTFGGFEVLVCDDASEQDVAGVIASLEDSRLYHLRNAVNAGVAATNIRGYRAARGRYVAHLDDDDEWEPRFLEVLVHALECHADCVLAFCDDWVIDAQSQVDPRWTNKVSRDWGRSRLRDGVYRPFFNLAVIDRAIPTSHASVIRRTGLDLDRFVVEVGYSWDLWVTYLACRTGAGAYFTCERLSRYRIHGAQVSGGYTDLRTYETLAYCDAQFLQDQALAVDRGILSRRLARTRAFWSVALARLGRLEEARAVARASIQARVDFTGLIAVALVHTPCSVAILITRALTGGVVRVRQLRDMWVSASG